jgi:4-oxalocrotonate tautomerase
MPFIRITTTATPSAALQQQLCARATDLIFELMGKRHEVTSVLFQSVPPAGWTIGAAPIPDGQCAAHCDIHITAGTNTVEEKAAMIRAMHAALGEALGALPEATYVVVHEFAATDWGYDGRTQADRRAAATPL